MNVLAAKVTDQHIYYNSLTKLSSCQELTGYSRKMLIKTNVVKGKRQPQGTKAFYGSKHEVPKKKLTRVKVRHQVLK